MVPQKQVPIIPSVMPAKAGMQKSGMDTGFCRYGDWNSDTHNKGEPLP
jgi:hypothetical protein